MSRCGVLSDADVKRELAGGALIIEPFNVKQLSTCSYDVRLGEYYYKLNPDIKHHCPWSQNLIRSLWLGPYEGESDTMCSKLYGLPEDTKYIRLPPQQTILGHTVEFIGGGPTLPLL